MQSQSLRIVTLMLVDLKIWSPQRAEEPADHDMFPLFTLFTRPGVHLGRGGQGSLQSPGGHESMPQKDQ